MTLQLHPLVITCWTMRERDVVIGDVVEEMDLVFLEKQAGGNGVDRSVTPPLIEEPTIMI